jgi:hypothetical protein
MKVGDLVLYKGQPSTLGLLTGSHMTTAFGVTENQVKLWHVHWVCCWEFVDPVTHEEEYVLEVFHGRD